jgi:hypothetical protein
MATTYDQHKHTKTKKEAEKSSTQEHIPITMEQIARMRPNAHLEQIIRQHEYLLEQIQGDHALHISRLKLAFAKQMEEYQNKSNISIENQQNETDKLASELELLSDQYTNLEKESNSYRSSLVVVQEENRSLKYQLNQLNAKITNLEKELLDRVEESESLKQVVNKITRNEGVETVLSMQEIDDLIVERDNLVYEKADLIEVRNGLVHENNVIVREKALLDQMYKDAQHVNLETLKLQKLELAKNSPVKRKEWNSSPRKTPDADLREKFAKQQTEIEQLKKNLVRLNVDNQADAHSKVELGRQSLQSRNTQLELELHQMESKLMKREEQLLEMMHRQGSVRKK